MDKRIDRFHQLIEDRLREIARELPVKRSPLYGPVVYSFSNGGKRVRPLLAMIGCWLFSGNLKRALHAAVAIELLHTFTLVHDDIMDASPIRRGRPTVFKKWGTDTAILGGDALLIIALQELEKCRGNNMEMIRRIFLENALEICEGQEEDMRFEKRKGVSEKEYMEMIRKKTAVLLGASLQIGALAGGAGTSQASALYNYGALIGLSFQIQDDMLDAFGSEQRTGKKKGSDIAGNKKNWLRVKAGASNRNIERSIHSLYKRKGLSNSEKVRRITGLYSHLGLESKARLVSGRFSDKAGLILKRLAIPENRKTLLAGFTEWLGRRSS